MLRLLLPLFFLFFACNKRKWDNGVHAAIVEHLDENFYVKFKDTLVVVIKDDSIERIKLRDGSTAEIVFSYIEKLDYPEYTEVYFNCSDKQGRHYTVHVGR